MLGLALKVDVRQQPAVPTAAKHFQACHGRMVGKMPLVRQDSPELAAKVWVAWLSTLVWLRRQHVLQAQNTTALTLLLAGRRRCPPC